MGTKEKKYMVVVYGNKGYPNPLDLNYQRTAIELRKYIKPGINRIKLKVSKFENGNWYSAEEYMVPIPSWDPTKIYKIRIEFEGGHTKAEIEVENKKYMVEVNYSWQHEFNVLVLGATPKYSAPPGAEFRFTKSWLSTYMGGD